MLASGPNAGIKKAKLQPLGSENITEEGQQEGRKKERAHVKRGVLGKLPEITAAPLGPQSPEDLKAVSGAGEDRHFLQ